MSGSRSLLGVVYKLQKNITIREPLISGTLFMDVWMDVFMDGWMVDGWMDGWIVDGWMDGWMVDGWMDGWMNH